MLVVDVPIGEIKIDKRARVEMGDLDELSESIKEKGLIQPLVLDKDRKLLAGERRFRAAQLAGLTKLPCVIRKTTGPIDALEIELLENAARKDFTWQEKAKLELRIFEAKKAADPTWSQRKQADLGSSNQTDVWRRIQLAEAMELLPDLEQYEDQASAWKELKKLEESYVADELVKKLPEEVKKAAKWARDHYRVGDAFEGMAATQAGVADFAEVDPPYGVDLSTDRKQRNKDDAKSRTYHEIASTEYVEFFGRVAAEVFRILKDNTFAVFWFGPTWHKETLDVLRAAGFGVPDIPAIWTKGGSGQTASPDTTFGSTYEPFWLARKGKPKLAKVGRGNDFRFDPVATNKKIHLTEKPIALLEEIISTICQPGSAILIPFLGSGVTLRAAYALGHTGWGYDLEEKNKELFLRAVQMDMAEGQ